MGGSKRKEEKKTKDEGRKKRHRTDEDEEGKSRRSHRSEKRHKHRSDKEKKKKKEDRRRDRHLKPDFQDLSGDDYFMKNNEFATWLKEEKDVFFSDLSSESSRELFKDFVKAWNSGDLEPRYYEGINSGPRTSHNWKFKK